jgi:hypothetical protein
MASKIRHGGQALDVALHLEQYQNRLLSYHRAYMQQVSKVAKQNV